MSVRTRGTPSPASKFTSGGRGGQQRPSGGKKAGGESRRVYYKALFGEVFDTALVFILPLVI